MGEPDTGARILLARGAQAAEALLLDAVRAHREAVRADPSLLARPLRIVVPSRSLREHVAAAIVREVGSVAGVEVQTLHGLALEVIEAAGEDAPRGDALVPVLVRRHARAEPELRAALGALEDGFGAVTGSVADLLDAGFGPELAEAVDDALAEEGWAARRERGRAVARVAARTAADLASANCGRAGARLRRARELLELDGASLASCGLLIHGYADATGLATDLLEALVRHRGATVILDVPPDPADPARVTPGVAFGDRLRERLEGAAGTAVPAAAPPPPASIEGVEAAGAYAEARAVAERVRGLLDRGVAPERIGVVARDLGGYAVPLRLHLSRLGVPFSGAGSVAAPPDGLRRRVQAALDLLVLGEAAPADRWLDALAWPGRSQRADLRLGLHAIGAARVRDVAGLDLEPHLDAKGFLPLPVRRGLVAIPDDTGDSDGTTVLARRKLPGGVLDEARARAAALGARFETWPDAAPFDAHRNAVAGLVERDLGWSARGRARGHLERALAGVAESLPDSVPLSLEEAAMLVRRAFAETSGAPLGGAGSGVALLGVVEARARSFEHLFVLGLNRDSFPRPILDDPVLADDLRRRLAPVLPAIPVKRRGVDEERFLFAQLVSSSPALTLSWQCADDDGRARAPSPLVEALRLDPERIVAAPSLVAPPGGAEPRYRTAGEALLALGLHASRRRFGELLPAALSESRHGLPDVDVTALADARLAVLAELDPDRDRARGLGPYFGFIGPRQPGPDPRNRPVYVTHLERIADCPWRHFLQRLLGLEPPPDALERLPHLAPLMLGNVVHRVLEAIVRDAGCDAESLDEARAAGPRAVPWPDAASLAARLDAAARDVLREEGMGPPGFARLLVEAARPHLDRARELDWPDAASGIACLGAEVTGVLTRDEGPSIHFKADRVDSSEGLLRLVDYKTGKPISHRDARAELVRRAARGRSLQAAAYAFATGGEGRLLYLRTSQDAGGVASLRADDAEARAAFDDTVARLLAAFEAGSFFPRLAKPDEPGAPTACTRFCEVREACLQGDAGARRRIFQWVREGKPADRAEAAVQPVWELPGRSAP
jgi:RecB family exonuclease